jgi:hypothetical protein
MKCIVPSAQVTEPPAISSDSSAPALPAALRWVLPSLGGLSVALLAVNVIGPVGARLLGDSDTGWHIVTGDLIRRTGAVPRMDPFSHTMPGREWFAWEWLADVLMSIVHQGFGLSGLIVMTTAVLMAAHAISFRQAVRRGADPMLAVPVLFLAALTSSVHWLARPHVLSILLMAVWLELAGRYRQQRSRAIWLVPVLTVLWANLHGAFVVTIVLAGVFLVGEWLEHASRGDWWGPQVRGVVKTYAGVAVLAAAAGLLTPYGFALYGHMAAYLGDRELLEAVNEFASPNFHRIDGVLIETLLFLAVVAAAHAARQKRFVEPLLVLAWTHLSLQSVRHVPLAAITMMPIIAREWTLLIRESLDAIPARSRWAAPVAALRRRRANLVRIDRQANDALLAVMVCAFFGVLLADTRLRNALVADRFSPRDFPAGAANVAQRGLAEGWLIGQPYSSDRFGGYLIYRFHGALKVFVDGRSDFYRQGGVLTEYSRLMMAAPAWSDLLRKRDVGWMLLTPGEALETVALTSGEWRREYSDRAASLLVRVR